ncbi:hypothetical protein EHO65_06860 [Leptospira andrefontaineae]|uniref:Uncharacterized protein n=1 Tax=Leptospira andrefontaineae TaxID=2484976 RepID=A0A4R9H8U5_9LEPT|nr:hypothetical protein EHO65_06860 [Leptospira andrefontaineae]
MREIDSAIREFIKPLVIPVNGKGKKGESNGHVTSITETLVALGISPQAEVGKLWLKFANSDSDIRLHELAHRNNLMYRAFNEQFNLHWKNFEIILDEVLDRFKRKYLFLVVKIEKLASLNQISTNVASGFRNTVAPGSPLFHIFLSKLSSIAWFDPLKEMKYFQFSEFEKVLIRQDSYFHWPPLAYFRRLIEIGEFDRVWSVIDSLAILDNTILHQEIVKLCLEMPDTYFLRWMEKEFEWFQRMDQREYINTDLYSKAIERVFEVGQDKFGLRLLSEILAVLPDPKWDYEKRTIIEGNELNSWYSPEPRFKLSSHDYIEFISYFFPILEKWKPWKLIQFLFELLDRSLEFSSYPPKKAGESYRDDHSYITRASIWDHRQNYNHKLSDQIIPYFRDAILYYVKDKASFEEVLSLLGSKDWLVFARMSIFLVSQKGWEIDRKKVREYLQNKTFADPLRFANEYYLLLSKTFSKLKQEEQIQYRGWLDGIASELCIEYEAEYREANKKEASEFNLRSRLEGFLDDFYYRKLPAIEEFLPKEKANYLNALKAKFKDSYTRPEFPYYHESFIGPTSPLENQELATLSIAEIIQKMTEFKKRENPWTEPSPEGLARQISRDVEINPERYLDSIQDFCSEEISNLYLGALLWGFRSALDSGKTLKTDILCEYLKFLFTLVKEKSVQETIDLQHTLASFLRTIFNKQIITKNDFEHFEFLHWIAILLSSSSPDEDYESKEQDLVSIGINSVRGNALHSLVYFLDDYFRRILEKNLSNAPSNQLVLKVYSILKEHFSGEHAERKTDRCVIGQYFAFLFWLNPQWFKENQSLFLNDNKDLSRIFFYSYLQYGSYSLEIYLNFREWFIESIEYLEELGDQVREEKGIRPFRLGDLLVNLYGNEVIKDCNDPILEKFFSLSHGFLKANAIRFLGKNVPDNHALMLDRTETLWKWRLEKGPSSEEYEEFSVWIDRGFFSDGLVFDTLKKIKVSNLRNFGIESYLKFLKANFHKNPLVSMQFIKTITEENSYYWNSKPGDNLWEILKMGISDSDSTVREITGEIIHRLSSFGYFQYRELLGI